MFDEKLIYLVVSIYAIIGITATIAIWELIKFLYRLFTGT